MNSKLKSDQQVPVPQATAPAQSPGSYDPADVIMQAAKLQLEKQNQQQKAMKDLSDTIMTTASLMERKRAAQADEAKASALLELQQREFESKKSESPYRIDELRSRTELNRARSKIAGSMEKPLTVQEAQALGVPYGTTKSQAAAMNRVPVSQSNRLKIQEPGNAMTLLNELETQFNKLDIGTSLSDSVLKGAKLKAASLHPATDAGVYAVQIKNISNLARAMGERGVLTDTDVARVMSNLPGFFDTKASAKKKLTTIRTIMGGVQSNMKKGLAGDILKSGGQVSELEALKAELASLGEDDD